MPGPGLWLPAWLSFRHRYHPARSVMEVKQHLLRCVRPVRPERLPVPSMIVVDAGTNNADIKSELERWIERHPRLRCVRVVCSSTSPWLRWIWNRKKESIQNKGNL
jgi:hypothetical protein